MGKDKVYQLPEVYYTVETCGRRDQGRLLDSIFFLWDNKVGASGYFSLMREKAYSPNM